MASNVPGSFKKEIDKSLTISSSDTVAAAIVIKSKKGRINSPLVVSNEAEYIKEFGKPLFSGKSKTPEYGYGAYAALKHLSISDKITIVRVPSVSVSGTEIIDSDEYGAGALKYESSTLDKAYYTDGSDIVGVKPFKEADATSYSVPVVPNTLSRIIDLDKAPAIADSKFTIFSSSPSSEGNNIAYSLEFFGGDSDWKYNYDSDTDIDDLVVKIKAGTATEEDITSLIAPQVFKLSFYDKNSSENWETISTKEEAPKPAKIIYASLNDILDDNKESLYIGDKIDLIPSLYFIENEILTNAELLSIVQKGFDDTTLVESSEDFKDSTNNFVMMTDSYGYVNETPNVNSYNYVAIPKDETADSSDLVGTVNSTSVKRLIASNNMEVRYRMDDNGDEGFYIRPIGTSTEGTQKYNLDVSGKIVNDADNSDFLTYADGTEIILPVKELVKESLPDSDQPGEFIFIPLKGGKEATIGLSDITNVQGWSYLANKEMIDANIILVPSYKTSVKQMVSTNVIGVRNDCVMEAQSGSLEDLTADEIITAENYGYNNPSRVMLTAGYTKVKDSYNDKFLFLPNMIFAAYTDVLTAIRANIWDSPAGDPRGVISGIEQLSVFSDGDLSKLFAANINAAKMFSGKGAIIWESLTSQRKKTALRSKNVRFTLDYIENTVEGYTNSLIHNINNTPIERTRVSDKIDAFIGGIKSSGGLYDYKVQVDEENNTPAVIDNEELVFWIFVKPARNVKFIKISYVITSSGASFDEIQL